MSAGQRGKEDEKREDSLAHDMPDAKHKLRFNTLKLRVEVKGDPLSWDREYQPMTSTCERQ
jgi:hypothetical protein